LTIREEEHQLFGKWRTGIYTKDSISERAVLLALARGQAIMTDGPVVQMSAVSSDGQISGIGDTVLGESLQLSFDVLSSEEFGEITAVRVIVGKVGNTVERTAHRFEGNQGFGLHKDISFERPAISYVRIEVTTSASGSSDGKAHFCLTNPIWIDSRS